jgi:hypothetical protein
MPRSWAASSASATDSRDGRRLRQVERAVAAVQVTDDFRQRPARHELHDDGVDGRRRGGGRRFFDAVNGRDVGVIERGQRPRLALESREPFGVVREDVRQGLDSDVAAQAVVAGTVDFAHAARTERGNHFIRPETRTWDQRHGLSVIIFFSANGAPPPFARPSRAPQPALGSGPQALMPPAPMGPTISYAPRRVPGVRGIGEDYRWRAHGKFCDPVRGQIRSFCHA